MTRVGRLGLLAGLGLELDIASSATVPGANDNATGVAALLALARRQLGDPIEGLEVVLVFPGAEESGMQGMAAFLRGAGDLDPRRTLVLGLDTLGSGTPIVCTGEATLLEHGYGRQELELVESAAAAADLQAPERWRIGTWTDPILARFAGLPAVSMLSVGPAGTFTHYHHSSDLPEHVDWDCTRRCIELAWATARTLVERYS
jgi:Zn-dependent M28 family amino/carboxypeptidase